MRFLAADRQAKGGEPYFWVCRAFGAGSATRLALIQWSIPTVKDHLALFTRGAFGQWTVPRTTGRDYIDQMTAEVREDREDARGRVGASGCKWAATTTTWTAS